MSDYSIDRRTHDERIAELAWFARRHDLPASMDVVGTWEALLFAGSNWVDPTEPSQALLDVLVDRHGELSADFNELPATAASWYLRDRLGIEAAPAEPDRVAVVAEGDPKKLPTVVPRGTVLKAGKRPNGVGDRLYRTDDAVTIVGATVAEVRSFLSDPAGPTDRQATWDDAEVPFDPFAATHPAAAHEVYLEHEILATEQSSAMITIELATPSAELFDELEWSTSHPDGDQPAAWVAAWDRWIWIGPGGPVQPTEPGAAPYVKAVVPPAGISAELLAATFDDLQLEVFGSLVPELVLANNGALDISQQCLPYGPTPATGSTFAVSCEEAMRKELRLLHLYFTASGFEGGAPAVTWERWAASSWFPTSPTSAATPSGYTALVFDLDMRFDPTTLGAHDGRFLRARIASGDYGWADYQARIRRFSAAAADPDATPVEADLLPAATPTIEGLRLAYWTPPVQPRIRTRNGFVEVDHGVGGTVAPFVSPNEGAITGTIEVGVDIAAAHLGQTLSLFVDVDAANACDPHVGDGVERWEMLVDGVWRSVDLIDGTSGFRQSGVIRVLAPADWTAAVPEHRTVRWLRFLTTSPHVVGAVSTLVPDAVMATYHPNELDLDVDDTPATPIASATITGPKASIPGLKKATNPLPSWGGRAPERGALERAPHQLRTRNRALNVWDYETIIADRFPEIAVSRCLPHTDASSNRAPGHVGLVVVPNDGRLAPSPSVRLAERIEADLRPLMPVHATPVVLCPLYELIGVEADLRLLPGEAAAEAGAALHQRLDAWLHPLSGGAAVFGHVFFRSSVLQFLEEQPEVDFVEHVGLASHPGVERIELDPCRGLIASSGVHTLRLTEAL